MKRLFLIAFLLNSTYTFATEKVLINEIILKDYINNNTPSIEKINLAVTQSDLQKNKYDEKYSLLLNANFDYQKTEGKVYNNYQGSYLNPEKKVGLSVNQSLPIGLNFGLGAYDGYTNSYSYSQYGKSIHSQYSSSIEAKITMDLWKNFLGYSEKFERLSLAISKKQQKEQAKIQKVKFYNEIRKLYWSLELNNSLANIYKSLIKQAILQEKNTNKMHELYVADVGDLAKAKALVNNRKAILLSTEYQIKQIKQQLSNLIPEFNNKEIIFKNFDYNSIKKKVVSCFKKIKNQKNTPFNLSSYTKLIQFKDQKINADLRSINRYSDLDLQLKGSIASLGYGDNNSDSGQDMTSLKRRDYSIGLNLSVPIGKNYTNTKLSQIKALKMQYNIEKKEIISNMASFHNYFYNNISNLFNIRKEQIKYKDNLLVRVKSMRKKYNQGRISLGDLIQDEDLLLQSELNVVSTDYQIIALFIDYFTIFNDLDCEFNIKL